MTDISFELENNELKEINLDFIENKIQIPENVGDIVLEMKKKNILENIKDLNAFEHQEIFKIVKKYNIRYSENSNGVFINMNKLGKRTINEIDKFINYCNSNKLIFQNDNKIRKNLKEFVDTKISQEKKEENIGVNKYQDSEEKIEKGISYKSDSCEEDNLEEIEDVDCSSKIGKNVNINCKNEFDKKIIDDLNII
jgi:hypothetical protein